MHKAMNHINLTKPKINTPQTNLPYYLTRGSPTTAAHRAMNHINLTKKNQIKKEAVALVVLIRTKNEQINLAVTADNHVSHYTYKK